MMFQPAKLQTVDGHFPAGYFYQSLATFTLQAHPNNDRGMIEDDKGISKMTPSPSININLPISYMI